MSDWCRKMVNIQNLELQTSWNFNKYVVPLLNMSKGYISNFSCFCQEIIENTPPPSMFLLFCVSRREIGSKPEVLRPQEKANALLHCGRFLLVEQEIIL